MTRQVSQTSVCSICAPFVLRLHHQKAFLELVDRRQPAFDKRLRVHVLARVEAMAELIGDRLAVDPAWTLATVDLQQWAHLSNPGK